MIWIGSVYSYIHDTSPKRCKKIQSSGLKDKTLKLINLISEDPLQYPPEFEYLKGDLKGLISRRINKQHRLVYEICKRLTLPPILNFHPVI